MTRLQQFLITLVLFLPPFLVGVAAALLFTSRICLADDTPTFVSNPDFVGKYATGFSKPDLTLEQFRAEKELMATAELHPLTFEADVSQVGKFATGYLGPGEDMQMLHYADDKPLKSKSLKDFGELTPILNQKNCGSCVVFAVVAAWMDTMRLRGMQFPLLSAQHLMNCGGPAGQCSGDYGSRVSQRLVNLQTLYSWDDYPYTARTSPCSEKDKEGQPRYGKIDEFKTIDGSVKSILSAIHNRQAVAVGVAANGSWSSYAGGVYNACNSMGINHYVDIIGVDCEGAVDADGYCVFDDKGNLPPGVGKFLVRNSWGENWGDGGFMTSKITNSKGQRCNALAYGQGNAQVYDTGVPVPPEEPVVFTMENDKVSLKVTVQPSAKYTAEDAKAMMAMALK